MRTRTITPVTPQPGNLQRPARGLGDSIANGIKRISAGRIRPCGGCKKRQSALNRLVPYKSKDAHHATPSLQNR